MENIFKLETWWQVFGDSVATLGANISEFLPKLVAMLTLLVAGWVLAKVAEMVASWALRKLGLDALATRLRVGEVLTRAGISSPSSSLVGRLLFWFLMLIFLLSALEILGFTAVTTTIERVTAYLPNVIAAGLIVLFAVLLGRLANHVAASGAAAVDWVHAERLGAAAKTLVIVVGGVLAIAQLGVETEILVSVITVLVGAMSLTMGIAFAMGARPVVTHILAGHFLRQSLPTGIIVEVEGRQGELERVGATDTLLRDGESKWSIPNRRLLDEIVKR